MTINSGIKVKQHSLNAEGLSFDTFGEVVNLEGAYRVVYSEDDTVQVILDITQDTCLLRRYGAWVTTCYFSKEESWVQIQSDEGVLIFDVELKKLTVQDGCVSVLYNLIQNGQIMDTFDYTCTWDKEVKTWQEIH